jgi:hypothetical protein
VSTAARGSCKSPFTNDVMGPQLLEAVQVRNLLEHLVRSDGLPLDRAQDWRDQIAERESIDRWRREAVGARRKGAVEGGGGIGFERCLYTLPAVLSLARALSLSLACSLGRWRRGRDASPG